MPLYTCTLKPGKQYASAASELGAVIKAAPGVLYSIFGNNTGAAGFLQVHNKTTFSGLAGQAPVINFTIINNNWFSFTIPDELWEFDTGILVAISSTTDVYTAVGAVGWFNVRFA